MNLTLVVALLTCPVVLQAAPPLELVAAARKQIGVTVRYDPAYTVLPYPNGDVPLDRGVCTDVVIRAMRAVGVDLQREVHEDMKRAFSAYPPLWGLRRPDRNIDHRRVPNLMRYFERKGYKMALTREPARYLPGDIVTCTVPPNLPHVMVVSDRYSSEDSARPLILHNIGSGTQEEDRLFEFKLTGHFRCWPE